MSEKTNHPKTPYTQTLNASSSPTFQKFVSEKPLSGAAKVIDFKPAQQGTNFAPPAEKESGEQTAAKGESVEQRSKRIGVLNLGQLDALEF